MTSARKKQSISDQINNILKPKDLTEENDEIEARVEEFTEHDGKTSRVSEIRRQTAKSLSELDSKYKGKVVSRKELEDDDESTDLESSDDDNLKQASGSDEEVSSAIGSDEEGLTEENDEIEAKVEEFTEHNGKTSRVSEIRRQRAKSLSELDSKYKGKVVSRTELEGDDESTDLESSDDDDNLEQASGSDEEESSAIGSDEEGTVDEESDQSGSEDEFDDGFDISQFSKPKAATSTAEDETELLKKSSLDEEVKKGVSVKDQLKIWEKLLEVRIKSQKMVITANRLPDFDTHLELASSEEFTKKVERTCDGLHGLLDNLLEMQTTLVNRFPETKNLLIKRKIDKNGSGGFIKKSKLAEYADQIEENHIAYTKYRNPVLQKWNERTKTAKDFKNPASNLNIVTKIDNALLRRREMVQKTQIYRGDYEICGVEAPEPKDNGTSTDVVLPEIFDDTEFYHQLLRELIEYKSNTDESQAEITQKFIELQKVRGRMKKKVDTRASKGRKIRYIVHNKLVNFLPPRDTSEWTDEAKNELYSSLFGMANQ